MEPRRSWKKGDEYWALWLQGDDLRYFPVFEGRVHRVDGRVVRLENGKWRFLDEGLPFSSLEAALHFIDSHPTAALVTTTAVAERRSAPQSGWRGRRGPRSRPSHARSAER